MHNRVVSHFSPAFIALRQIAGPRPRRTATTTLLHRVRQVILYRCPQLTCPWLNADEPVDQVGKQNGGSVALPPLAGVGRRYADGYLLGTAIIELRHVQRDEMLLRSRNVLFDAHGGLLPIKLKLGRRGVCTVQVMDEAMNHSFMPSRTGCEPSRRWASVTGHSHLPGSARPGRSNLAAYRTAYRSGLPTDRVIAALGGDWLWRVTVYGSFPGRTDASADTQGWRRSHATRPCRHRV